MTRSPLLARRLVLAALMLLAVGAAGLVLAWENRSVLGLGGEELVACSPDPDRVRLPEGNASPAGRWAPSTPFPAMRDELRATAVGDVIYVGLGLQPGGPLDLRAISKVYAFDPERETFRRVADLPSRLDHPAMAADGRYVYLVGGWLDGIPSAKTWRYDPRRDRWEPLPPLRFPRAAAGAAVIGNRLYVAGGVSQRHESHIPGLASLEIYDLDSRRWLRGADMPTPRHHHGVAAAGGKLYALGGRDLFDLSLDAAEAYDPKIDRWEKVARLPLGVGGVAAVAAGDRVVAIAGGDDDEGWVTPATWALTPSGWQRLPNLSVPRHGHAGATVNGRAFVFGGAPCPGYGKTNSVETVMLRP